MSDHTQRLRTRILASTTTKQAGDGSTWIAAKEGRMLKKDSTSEELVPGCYPCSDVILTVSSPIWNTADSPYDFVCDISWDEIPCVPSYTVTYSAPYPYAVVYTGPSTAKLYISNVSSNDFNDYDLTVTANGPCPVSSIQSTQPCFLAGSIVHLADGSQKAIEDVVVGDLVIGAFGEINPVLALHRPLMGSARMIRINEEHSSTAHHPHVSVNCRFYCADPATVENNTYGREHDVIDGSGVTVKRMLYGLKQGRVQRMETVREVDFIYKTSDGDQIGKVTTGTILKTIQGSRPLSSLETYVMPPETQLYNLVTGGSHTYHVDGYAVTGWPREDDWDYDTWKPRPPTLEDYHEI